MGCGDRGQGDYTLFVYPEGASMSSGAIITPGFGAAEMCRYAGQQAVGALKDRMSADFSLEDGDVVPGGNEPAFECGRVCRYLSGVNIAVCKDTFN